ncbi:MAG TPA: glycosyltransferase family 2 protein [Pirellulaceae bacterium]|nr:glycosyltransferase family 2 protein [Pirellulaceae bacterium]
MMKTTLESAIRDASDVGKAPVEARVNYSLDELERLAELLAVDDGYMPTSRDFVIPRNFKLSIVIPVYNEQATIQQVLANVVAVPIPKEIIIVDDASTDGTRQVLSQYEAARDVHVIFKPQNEGKGAALRTGLRRVTGDIVVVQDADLEYDPRDILNLVRPILCGQADVVYGSRFLNGAAQDRSFVHRFGNRLLTKLSNWTTGLDISDMETGYKAFRREVLKSFEIKQHRFGFEPEVTARIARNKYRLYEVPISYTPRGYAQGKKIGLADLFSTLYCIIRYAWAD